jgi:hypothetical protein
VCCGLPQSDWIRRDELKDLSDTLQKIKFDAGRTGAPRPSAATMMGGNFMGGSGQTPYMAAGLNDPLSGQTTQAGWSGRPGAGTQGGPQAWPPGPPGGFTPGSRYYGNDGSYGTPYGQTPYGQTPGQHPNYPYGTTPGQQGQYLGGVQGQTGGHQGQMVGYPGHGQDWHDGQDQYRAGHSDYHIDGMDSFFQKIENPLWTGTKPTPAAKSSPRAGGRGGAGGSGAGIKPGKSGTAAAGGHGGGFWSSSDHFDESEDSRHADDRGHRMHDDPSSGGASQPRPPQQHPRRRKSKDHRGVKADEMQKMFKVLVSFESQLCPLHAFQSGLN